MAPERDTLAAGGIGGDRRPLTARSVIASTLLGVDPPRLPTNALVRSGELFGLTQSATRTALSRMVSAGDVQADDGGYVLVGPLLERHDRQQRARRRPADTGIWDGTWELAVVTSPRRSAADRAALRTAARRLGLAELREGCWTRPANLDPARLPRARAVVDEQSATAAGVRPDRPASFVAAFEPDRWAQTARALIEEMRASQPQLDAGDTTALGSTFVVAAHVLRHLVDDPSMPPELVGADWPGPELRSTFDRYDRGFKATWSRWYRAFRDHR